MDSEKQRSDEPREDDVREPRGRAAATASRQIVNPTLSSALTMARQFQKMASLPAMLEAGRAFQKMAASPGMLEAARQFHKMAASPAMLEAGRAFQKMAASPGMLEAARQFHKMAASPAMLEAGRAFQKMAASPGMLEAAREFQKIAASTALLEAAHQLADIQAGSIALKSPSFLQVEQVAEAAVADLAPEALAELRAVGRRVLSEDEGDAAQSHPTRSRGVRQTAGLSSAPSSSRR